MAIIDIDGLEDAYDVVVAGSGFGSLFFLHKHLQKNPGARVLVLERGKMHTRAWQLENEINSDIAPEETYEGVPGEKPWLFTIGVGGGTNCWWGLTPRLHPNDFRMRSLYGVGRDWAISYDELIPYYQEAEAIMNVAGPEDMSRVWPGADAYRMPAHRLSTVDEIMKAAQPDQHFAFPSARISRPLGERGRCCSSARCNLCPVDAKFTAFNSMDAILSAPNVSILPEARVDTIETAGGLARGVNFTAGGAERTVRGELVVLGANAIHSPHILLKSGIDDGPTGKYLHEKKAAQVEVYLDGLDCFDGGTVTTGLNTSLHDGSHRSEYGGALVFFENRWNFGFRAEPGRTRQILPLVIFVEDMPQEVNHVAVGEGEKPLVRHPVRSDYVIRGIDAALGKLPDLLAPLPVEKIERRDDMPTAGHVQGTLRMGTDPADSVVDGGLIHHRLRNLVVVGTSVFPTCGNANPSLTAAALSLRAADLLGGQA